MQKTQGYAASRAKTFDLILTSMLASLVFVATLLLNIKLPIGNGGLIHLGTAMLFIASILFGPKKCALAGAIGMGLFDLISGWTLWAPITFLTRGLQGYIVGKIAWSNGRKGTSLKFNLLAMTVSVPITIAGYYIGERILYNSWIIPLASIPGDIVQCIVGIAIAIPVCAMLKKVQFFK